MPLAWCDWVYLLIDAWYKLVNAKKSGGVKVVIYMVYHVDRMACSWSVSWTEK